MFQGTSDDCSSKFWFDLDLTTLVLTYNIDGAVDAETLMTLTGQDPHNDAASMTIKISVDFAPNTGYSDGGVTATFIALENGNMTVPADLFSDEVIANLTFTAAADGYSTWPTWLTFTPPTINGVDVFEISGIYPDFASDNRLVTLNVTITAEDDEGLTESVVISIFIESTCHMNCETCSGKAIDECTSCEDGRFLYLSTCGLTCPEGFYADDTLNECLA